MLLSLSLYIYIFIYMSWLIVVGGDQTVPFSIVTLLKSRGEHNFFTSNYTLALDRYLIMLSVKQGGIKYHFGFFGITQLRIKLRFPGLRANTLCQCDTRTHTHTHIYIYICQPLRSGTRSIFKRSLTDSNSDLSFS